MKRWMLTVALLLFPFVAVASSPPPQERPPVDPPAQTAPAEETANVKTSCDGSQCGCHLIYDECVTACGPIGTPGRAECLQECRSEELQCSICCCDPGVPAVTADPITPPRAGVTCATDRY